jgi:DNA-binding transcriptional LysR family regulator
MPAVTLDQWQTLIAVVDKGGYAAAAEVLNKSQSTVSYAIQKLESSLNIRAFSIDGRRAILTPAGKTLYQRAKVLLEEANQLETQAQQFSEGWEPELRIAMDTLFPEWVMLDVIDQFIQAHPLTRIELMETVLSGTDEALLKKEADIVIGGRIPPGFLGDPILLVNFCAVASPNHPLHQLNRPLNYQDLRLHRQLVVKDSGSRDLDAGWLGAQHRLTLGHLRISIDAACKGLGYAWFPTLKIQHELDQGQLKPLNLDVGGKRDVQLNLIYSAGDYTGPAAKLFGSLLTTHTANIAT